MLQETLQRVLPLGDRHSAIVVCNETHRFLVAEQIAALDAESSIILEPEGRNTAPAIALAALYAKSPDSILLVMPADHVIEDVAAFHHALDIAKRSAADGALVTFGIVPTQAHTGYGYIEADAVDGDAVDVASFVEKPDQATAQAYVNGGRHFWNSGMFVFRADRYLEALQTHAPEMAAAVTSAMQSAREETDFVWPDKEEFLASPSDSIDYAVMEKTSAAKMVALDAGWNDVGSWSALHDVKDVDDDGNVRVGDTLVHDCRNSYISSESRLVTAVGTDDIVVVETKDAVLVADKNRAQDVKHIVDQLTSNEREEASLHRQVFRPWGSYDSIDSADGFQVKRLIVNPGAVLSLQMHHHRAEHWVVVRGSARITLNDDEFDLGVNESTYIPIGATHRIANVTDSPVHIVEVQCGDYLGEDDIVRFEDNYGREGTNT